MCVKIDLSCLELEPVSFDERFTVEPERLDSEVLSTPVVVRLEGEVRPHGDGVSVLGRFRADGRVACSRCLETAAWTVDEHYSVEFQRAASAPVDEELGLDEKDLDIAFLEGEELDLMELATEQILLALPMRILCNESCAGLCPTCGANRNRTETCDCTPDVDPRWQALAGLAGSGSDS